MSERRKDQATATTIVETLRMKTAFGTGAAHALAARRGSAPPIAERALAGRHDPRQARWAQFGQYRARRDTAGERTVEISLDLQNYCGTQYAAAFLCESDIDFETPLRALTRKWLRRNLVMA